MAADFFPKVVFRENNAPAGLVEHVKSIIATLDFTDSSVFPPDIQSFYHAVRLEGFRPLMQRIAKYLQAHDIPEVVFQARYCNHLGTVIYDRLSQQTRRMYFPYNDMLVHPSEHSVLIRFSSLLKERHQGNTFYYSPRQPRIRVKGERYIIAFSNHAIEQTCKRIYPSWDTYDVLGDAFSFFHDCMYFEECSLYPDQLAFTFYQDCYLENVRHPKTISFESQYCRQLIGADACNENDAKWYFRVGYCPAEITGEFIVGKTLLFPGFRNTPEYGKLQMSGLPKREKEQLKQKASDDCHTAEYLVRTSDYKLVKWFHDNGVPQVVRLKGEVFAPAADDEDIAYVREAEKE